MSGIDTAYNKLIEEARAEGREEGTKAERERVMRLVDKWGGPSIARSDDVDGMEMAMLAIQIRTGS